MNKLIILAKLLGLNEKSKDTADFMAHHLKDIYVLDSFIEYCEDHKDELNIWSKEERFATLAKNYKKLEEAARLEKVTAKAAQDCMDLAERFKIVRDTVSYYYDNTGKDLRPAAQNTTTKQKLFTEKELAALDELGSIAHQVELSQLHRLSEELQKLYMRKYQKKATYNALTEGQKKVQGLLNGNK